MTQTAPLHHVLADGPPGGRAAWLHAADGVRLRAAHWPAQGKGRGTVLLARLASVVVAVLVLHVAVNTLACTVLPLSSPVGVFRMAGAMHLGLLVQTAFACLAVVALTGVITLLAPPVLPPHRATGRGRS